MSTEEKLKLCSGCRDDYYNHDGNSDTGRCWLFNRAQVVTRYRIGWWTQPTQPGAFTKVTTLSCHNAPGRYAQYEQLPSYAQETTP